MFKRPKLHREDNEGKHPPNPSPPDRQVQVQFLFQNFELGPLTRSLIREITAFIFSPPRATTLGGEASAIPKGSTFMAQLEKLDYASDKVDALLKTNPDGKLDGPPAWTGINNADQSNIDNLIEASPDGKMAIVRLPVDTNQFDFTITAKADVDDPSTPDVESVSTTYHIAGEHSKATDLGGSLDSVAKGAGFP